MEAADLGFQEGIALDVNGLVSEGSGENIFVVYRGVIYTPPVGASILMGVTRECVLTLAQRTGHRGPRAEHPARDAVRGRRDLLHRHRGRDLAHSLGGQDAGRRRLARSDHRRHPGGVLRHCQRKDARPSRLAHSCGTHDEVAHEEEDRSQEEDHRQGKKIATKAQPPVRKAAAQEAGRRRRPLKARLGSQDCARRRPARRRRDAGRPSARRPRGIRSRAPPRSRRAIARTSWSRGGRRRGRSDGLYRAVIDAAAPQALRADHAAVHLRRSALRALVSHGALGCARPLQAHERLQRALPDRLRCLRPAGGERRHQARHPPQEVDLRQHREHAPAAAPHGHHVRLGARGHLRRPRVLQVDAVVLHPALQARAGLPQALRRGLVPEGQHHPGARAGRGREPRLRALRHAGDQEGPGAVVLQGHGLRRRAAELRRASIGPSASRPCRPTGSAAARAPRWSSRPKPATQIEVFTTRPDTLWGATFMVFSPEHPLVDQVTTPEQKAAVEAYKAAGRAPIGYRARGGRQGEDRRLHRRLRHQPRQRRAHPDLDRRLRPDVLRHRRHHGRAGAR